MNRPWIYAIAVFALYTLVVAGVPLFPDFLGASLFGHFTAGMLLFIVLHTVPLVLSALYLRSRTREGRTERAE